jgi:inosose dehydratase
VNGSIKVAGAPISWGICEVAGWGEQLSREQVLTELAAAGLSATELGPDGFFPGSPEQVAKEFKASGLTLVGGFVPAVLHIPEKRDAQIENVERNARILSGAGAEVLVLAAETGITGYETSVQLDEAGWNSLAAGVDAVEKVAARNGLKVALHPHYGTMIQTAEDISRFLEMTTTSLCLDTGHLMVAGADPVAVTRSSADRISHVHLKDVDAFIAARVRRGEIGYRDAVVAGMYRPLGDGDVDLGVIMELLADAGYDGWYVLEQDLVITGNGDSDTPLRNATRSLKFLRTLPGAVSA